MPVDLNWILESLPVGLWVARVPDGEVVYANPEFQRILGVGATPGVTIGDAPKAYGIFTRDGRPYPVERLPFSRVVATGRPVSVDDIVIHRPDGRKIDLRAFGYPAFDAQGVLAHVEVAFLDISAEVAAKVERQRMEARLALAVNNAPIVIWATDRDGVITLSEGAGLAGLGVASGQLVGQSVFALYKDHPEIPRFIRRGLAGETLSYTVRVGDTVFDTWMMPIRDPSGALNGVSALSHDVSEMRKLQANAIQNDRAIAIGTLAASVAHEINNPLTYMLGHLDLLNDELNRLERDLPSLPEAARDALSSRLGRLREAVEPARAGTQRIASITRELGTFSRPSADEDARVDARAVVTSVLKLVRKEVEARAELRLDLGETAAVRGNASRLTQVVLNLMVNATQALSEERRGSNRITVLTRNEGGQVAIEVGDSGPGIPPRDRERVFEPFVTTKEVGQGTGLGLFVSRNIVRGFGGTLTVGDQPGGGALFRVLLPAAGPAMLPPRLPKPAASSGPASAHVLIVDDDPPVAALLRARLAAGGYQATIEKDPTQAVELLASGGDRVDLVYCDLMMPGMSGMDVADALEARAPGQLAKVVFMTGGAFTPRAQAFRERHADRVVDKPFDVLAETARRLGR
ncbi:MAG TPA: ATP-binding protein [Planctomycetota bacterium]